MRDDVRYEGIRYIISDYLEAEPSPEITERELRAYAEFERLHFYDSPDTVQAIVAGLAGAVSAQRARAGGGQGRRAPHRLAFRGVRKQRGDAGGKVAPSNFREVAIHPIGE